MHSSRMRTARSLTVCCSRSICPGVAMWNNILNTFPDRMAVDLFSEIHTKSSSTQALRTRHILVHHVVQHHACHVCPPAMHAPLPHMPPCHTCPPCMPPPCTPLTMHAPLPSMPPPLPRMPPQPCMPPGHACPLPPWTESQMPVKI